MTEIGTKGEREREDEECLRELFDFFAPLKFTLAFFPRQI